MVKKKSDSNNPNNYQELLHQLLRSPRSPSTTEKSKVPPGVFFFSYRTNPAVFKNSSSRKLDRLFTVVGDRTESEEATREKPKADAKVWGARDAGELGLVGEGRRSGGLEGLGGREMPEGLCVVSSISLSQEGVSVSPFIKRRSAAESGIWDLREGGESKEEGSETSTSISFKGEGQQDGVSCDEKNPWWAKPFFQWLEKPGQFFSTIQ